MCHMDKAGEIGQRMGQPLLASRLHVSLSNECHVVLL